MGSSATAPTSAYRAGVARVLAPLLERPTLRLSRAPTSFEEFRAPVEFSRTEVMQRNCKLVLRNNVMEGDRFPESAEFHRREATVGMLAFIADVACRADRGGILRADAYSRSRSSL